jgi:hypothetical protein
MTESLTEINLKGHERIAEDREPGPVSGAPGGTRTPNLLIRSQVLYPLSYGRIVPTGKSTG